MDHFRDGLDVVEYAVDTEADQARVALRLDIGDEALIRASQGAGGFSAGELSIRNAVAPAEVVNVGDINRLFPQGGDIGPDEVVAAGAVRKNTLVKVLGDGKLAVKVNVSAHKFSGSARDKITSAGGSATEL